MEKRAENLALWAAVTILVAGCAWVLMPFLKAMLLAAVVCISSWPLFLWLLDKMKGRESLAAFTMTLSIICVVILPLALVAYNLSDNVASIYDVSKRALDAGPPQPPIWLPEVPIVGNLFYKYWYSLANNHAEIVALEKRLLEPAKDFLLAGGILLGRGVVEMSVAAFISFFFFRNGIALIHFLNVAMDRVIGVHVENVFSIISNTVRGVMFGILGTALAQSLVATIGFVIAGVPAALLLGLAVAVLSLIPAGPPLVWGGAAVWLFYHGPVGWAVFMFLWGIVLISGIDNVVKPLLISRSSNLPFILGLFGIVGGVLAFGFVGIFIGPTLLAVGLGLLREWANQLHTRLAI